MTDSNARDLRELIVSSLAHVAAVDPAELRAELEETGDLEFDSKRGQTVAILVEEYFEIEGLVRGPDQTTANLSSLSALMAMLSRRIEEETA